MRFLRITARTALMSLALTVALVLPVSAATGSINATDVRFRSVPNTASQAAIIRLLGKGTTLEVLKKENSWYQVKIGETTGYVYSTYVTVHPDPVVTPAPTSVTVPVPPAVPATGTAEPEVVAAPVLLTSEITLIAAPESAKTETATSAAATPVSPAVLTDAPAPATTGASTEIASAPVPENRMVVEATALNIRQTSSSTSALLGKVVYGQEITLLEPGEGYSKIVTDSGLEGYILGRYLVPVVASVSRASNELADELISYAMTFQGVKYVYAGMSPNGFDCSGFVKYVYQGIGIDTPRSSRDYGAAGVKVARAAMVPGDVILWDTDGSRVTNISHVGIYVGNDKFIHASSSLNRVLVASVSGYQATFLGVRRFLE